MPNRVYALLVAVSDYAPPIEPLDGCLNDVDLLHDHLRRHVDPAALAVRVLANADATRANIIAGFRSHLGQARAGDVALFQFCGHGAQWATSATFRATSFDGWDEGLVCHDSRRPGGYDLADKELAVLIAEVAARDAHTVVVLDCCHSGSGTRAATPSGTRPRLTHAVTTERPLESYLDGHYARVRDAGQPLVVPAGRHILLSACERGQLAQEAAGHGVFTRALVEVLEASGGALSYGDVFVRCRASVRARAFDQDPQVETYGRFDAGAGFLGRPLASGVRGRYLAYCDLGAWAVDCGALQGLPNDPGAVVTFALYAEADATTPAGTARAVLVLPRRCEIELDFESAESVRYLAEVTSLPAAPEPIAFIGDTSARTAVGEALAACGVHASLVGANAAAAYALVARDQRLGFRAAARDVEIGFAGAAGADYGESGAALAPAVRQVVRWERSRRLQNHRTTLDRSAIDFVFVDGHPDAGGKNFNDDRTRLGAPVAAVADVAPITLAFAPGRPIHGRLRVRNRSGQPLFAALAYFSDAFGIHSLANEPIASGDAWTTLWGDGADDYFVLADGVDASLEIFMLIVATEKIDDFLLAQPPLELGSEYSPMRGGAAPDPPQPVARTNDWCTRTLEIRVVRQPAGVHAQRAGQSA